MVPLPKVPLLLLLQMLVSVLQILVLVVMLSLFYYEYDTSFSFTFRSWESWQIIYITSLTLVVIYCVVHFGLFFHLPSDTEQWLFCGIGIPNHRLTPILTHACTHSCMDMGMHSNTHKCT